MPHAHATPAQNGFRADRALCALMPGLNRRAAKLLFRDGQIRLNGKVSSGGERVRPGDNFEFPDPAAAFGENVIERAKAPRLTTPHGRHLTRLYEDDDLLVINKPAEIPVHRGQGGFTRRDTLEDVLLRAYPPKTGTAGLNLKEREEDNDAEAESDEAEAPGRKKAERAEQGFYFVHRLDMETSGCLLIAKHAKARDALIRDFSARKIHKEYLGVVVGAAAWDRITSRQPITYVRGEAAPKKSEDAAVARQRKPFWTTLNNKRVHEHGGKVRLGQKKGIALPEGSVDGKACETHFEVLERFRGYALVHCEPKTGRTHQIRVHLAALGHALAYDPLYGRKSPFRISEFDRTVSADVENGPPIILGRLPLHAWKLAFTHPVSGKRLEIEAPLPRDLREFIRALKKFKSAERRERR